MSWGLFFRLLRKEFASQSGECVERKGAGWEEAVFFGGTMESHPGVRFQDGIGSLGTSSSSSSPYKHRQCVWHNADQKISMIHRAGNLTVFGYLGCICTTKLARPILSIVGRFHFKRIVCVKSQTHTHTHTHGLWCRHRRKRVNKNNDKSQMVSRGYWNAILTSTSQPKLPTMSLSVTRQWSELEWKRLGKAWCGELGVAIPSVVGKGGGM